MKITKHHVEVAYRKLKRYVYYDKTDLHLRYRLSEFECSSDFQSRLSMVMRVVNSKAPINSRHFKKWLSEIDFRLVPKSLSSDNFPDFKQKEGYGKFISNVTSSKYLDIEKVNYFFDGPIELHLIAVLWIMFEGRYLDLELGKECYGSRLSACLSDENDESAELFRKYHELYAKWRDTGLEKAKRLLVEDKTSVCILGLDVQEYYYRIKLDFSDIANVINTAMKEEELEDLAKETPSNLLNCLKEIYINYYRKIELSIQETHTDPPSNNTGIPIGLCSSPVLANWYLKPFDEAVKAKIKPAYYGRYVDDILLVVETSVDPPQGEQPVADFINTLLVNSQVLHPPKENRYELVNPEGLYLQQSKCILQYFNIKHSIAGLEKFKKKIDENSSDFLLLPVDEADNSLEDVAYELMYEGSVNKFRSVKGLAENRYELAKNLARQTILHLLTNDPPNREVSLGLRKFFKGRNAILFHDLWERVFTYFVISNDTKSANFLENSLRTEINRLRMENKRQIIKILKLNLENHLSLSRAMSYALVVRDAPLPEGSGEPNNTFREQANFFKKANLIRHHFIRLPLLNYTNFNGPLTTRTLQNDIKIDSEKLKFTPRFINFDECLLLAQSNNISLHKLSPFKWACWIFELANTYPISGICVENYLDNNENYYV